MSTQPALSLREFTHDSPITIDTAEQPIEMSVADVIRWVAPGAPPSEALKFLLTCRTARLNPFLGDAFLVNLGGKWSTIISKAGYLKRAQEKPDFAGFEAGIIIQQIDQRTKQMVGEVRDIPGTMLPSGWIVVGGWAKVWRHGLDRPISSRISMAEYNKGTATWKTTPCTMIRKTALVHAIREAFAIGDSYDVSEVNAVPRMPVVAATADRPHLRTIASGQRDEALELAYQPHEDPSLPPQLLVELNALIAEAGMSAYELDSVLSKRMVTKITDLSIADARTLMTGLRNHIERRRVAENFPALPEDAPSRDLVEHQSIDPGDLAPSPDQEQSGEIPTGDAGDGDEAGPAAQDEGGPVPSTLA